MQRFIALISLAVIIGASSSIVFAQADAAAAFEQGRAAYASGQWTSARDLFLKASHTDTRNPEVFLWLGRAEYQLGAVDKAIAAWKRTLKLAPEQPYAARMLAVLRGEAVEIDTRIKLIEVMLQERLYRPALSECTKLLDEKALSELQRAKAMTLKADLLVRTGKYADAQKVLQDLLVLYPQQADPAQTTLLLGQAKLRGDEKAVAEGLVLLKKVVADYPDTPAAALAKFELIAFELRQGINAVRADAMAQWLAANGDHELADWGRQILLGAYLNLTGQGSKPTAESDLSPTDVKALALAAEIYGQDLPAGKADALTKQLLGHLKTHYVNHGAHAAAVKATETLLAAPLPRSSRLSVLKALASSKYLIIAVQWLEETGRAGQLPVGVPRGQLPEKLTDILATFETIRTEYPAVPFWTDQANLAKRVRLSASRVLPTAEFKGLKGPDAWALDIALPVIKANADAAAVKSAVQTVQAIIDERAKVQKPGSRKLAVDLGVELLEAISPSHSSWSGAMVSYYNLAGNYAHYVFQENIKTRHAEKNAKLSEQQKTFLAILKKQAEHMAHSPHVLMRLAEHVKPWAEHGHWSVAEEVYTTVMPALPEKERRLAELAVANLWIQQVTREHQRLVAAGLTVPRELHPTMKKALLRCYRLQAGLDQERSILAQVRNVWDSIIGHYKKLEYFDTVEQAINVKPSKIIDAADAYANLQLANLKFELARRELSLLLNQYDGTEKIKLTPAFETAIEAYVKFISERPSSPLRSQAVAGVFQIAQVFERHKAYDVAVKVYRDFAAFAAKVKALSQAAPGSSSVVERAAFAAAAALDAKARLALSRELEGRKDAAVAPAKVSSEFTAAIEAYKNFIKAYPKSVLLGHAIEKIMAVALEYARVDAWDVAESIYAGLLAEELAIRRVERIEFCRGLCQLGKVIPKHAKGVLTTLTLKEIRRTGGADEKRAFAKAVKFDALILSETETARLSTSTEPSEDAEKMPATRPGGAGFYGGEYLELGAVEDLKVKDSRVLAAIRQEEVSRAARVARLREQLSYRPVQQGQKRQASARAPVLSDAEITRQEKALNAAYEIFQAIRKKYPHTSTAEQARGEVKVMIDHWRTISQWQRAAGLAERFLKDNPTDKELPALRLSVARDYLAWAAKPVEDKPSKQLMLGEVAQRFTKARDELTKVVTNFPKERTLLQQAQWDIANSFLTQARVVDAFSATLARGQYVRATKELLRLADEYYDHPKIGTVPQMLWDISGELANRKYYEEAITVWNDLMIRFPTHALAQQAALRTAQTYQNNLEQPLRAAEAYQEVNVARGGNDAGIQNTIYQIGVQLKNKKRWVEALHVLEMFVDSFPRHPQAGQALTMVGQVHQTNEAWEDAIAAYRRVITEFPTGNWIKDAKWSIAECTINLSRWQEAMDGYEAYVRDYPGDGKVTEAKRRVGILKDLVRYQTLVDEKGQRKAFDAQYQIATIVSKQLSNRIKAIIEYRKVAANWAKSHLADDALYAVATTYLAMGETDKAREAAKVVAKQYPESPLADDALYLVGKSYEDEANKLAAATRAKTAEEIQLVAQSEAYQRVQEARGKQVAGQQKRIASLRQAGLGEKAELEEASAAAARHNLFATNVALAGGGVFQAVEALTATQLANRQDKINAALRRAVSAYDETSRVPAGDKAGDALLRMATIYDERLKDPNAAMAAWLEIVRQFSGTAVAENASWRIAQSYEHEGEHAKAIEAYKAFLRNYRRSSKAGDAQFAIAENYEHLGQWVNAMDAYTNYINNFPSGPMVQKAREQINWIKAYRL